MNVIVSIFSPTRSCNITINNLVQVELFFTSIEANKCEELVSLTCEVSPYLLLTNLVLIAFAVRQGCSKHPHNLDRWRHYDHSG